MIDANIPIVFWAEMINTASYLQKRSPTAALNGRTPYEILYQSIGTKNSESNQPALHHLRCIGCVAYHRTPDEKFQNKTTLKFGPRSTRCMLIGYTESTKIWKLWDIAKQRAIRSADVVFIEQENAMTENPSDMGEQSQQLKALAPQNESTEQAPQVSKAQRKHRT